MFEKLSLWNVEIIFQVLHFRHENHQSLPSYGFSDLESFQEDLINVLNHIQDLKVQCKGKVEELITEQNQLNEDIKLYSERLCLWTESPKLDLQKNLVHSKIKTTNNDLPNVSIFISYVDLSEDQFFKDVRKFMDFVKVSNGHENGWTLSDHQLFLKLRKKFPDVNALCLNIHEMLPGKYTI